MRQSDNFVLNDTQRKLVEDNHNLIYFYLNKKHLSMDSVFDFYGDAAIGLCIAAYIYKPELGYSFSTLAYRTMENEINATLRHIDKTIQYILTNPLGNDEDIDILDNIEDATDYIELSELKLSIKKIYNLFNDRDKLIIKLYFEKDYTYKKIGEMFGLTKQAISLIIIKFKSNVYNILKNS